MEIFEQLARFTDAERLRRRSRTENFECTFAGIAMGTGDPMKLSVGNVGGGLQRAENDRPADLQRAQIALGKCSSETVGRKHSPGPYQFDVADQIVIIGMVRKSKCGVDLIPVNGIWVDGPTTDHRHAFARNSFQHVRSIRAWWADEDFSCNVIRVVTHVFAKGLAELLVDARHLVNGAMQHWSQPGSFKRTQYFLR